MSVLAEMIRGAGVDEGNYRAWDDMGVEAEVAEFLYALVRVLKPDRVVESGTGSGYSAVAIAAALAENRFGTLTSFEPLPEFRARAAERLSSLPASIAEGYACDHCQAPWPDLVFLDSFGTERPREIAFWAPLPVRLVIHDAREHAAHLPAGGVTIETPRGLWLRV